MSRTSARLSLGFSCAGHTFSHLFMLLYPVVVLTLEQEWGRSYESLLPLSFAGFVLFGAAALPAGWLGDRWSSSGMMAVFFLGTGASAIAAGLAQGPAQMAVALGAIGAFAAIYHPVGLAWLVRNAANRGKALGFNGVFGSLGTALAAAVAGALTDWISWRAAFLVPGAVAVAVGLVFVVLIRRGAVLDGTRRPWASRPRSPGRSVRSPSSPRTGSGRRAPRRPATAAVRGSHRRSRPRRRRAGSGSRWAPICWAAISATASP